jgi:hypothetical protein
VDFATCSGCPGYALQQSLAVEFRLLRGRRIIAHVLELLLLTFQPFAGCVRGNLHCHFFPAGDDLII